MQELAVCINFGGSGHNFVVGDVHTKELLLNEKVRPSESLPLAVKDQFTIRTEDFRTWMTDHSHIFNGNTIRIVVSRGPILLPDVNGRPNSFGIYSVSKNVIKAIGRSHLYTVHASQLSPVVAYMFVKMKKLDIPIIFADPISGMRLPSEFELSGHPKIKRRPLGHWLNIHRVLKEIFGEESWKNHCFIIVHLGTGATIASFRYGKLVNVNDANAFGPFTDTRAGGLPTEQLIDLVAEELKSKTTQQIKDELQGKCGLAGYLGIADLKTVLEKVQAGDPRATLFYQAMVKQIAAEIAGRASELSGEFDRVIITGGMAQSETFMDTLNDAISWFVPTSKFVVVPGSFEAQAMIEAAHDVIVKGVTPIEYGEFAA